MNDYNEKQIVEVPHLPQSPAAILIFPFSSSLSATFSVLQHQSNHHSASASISSPSSSRHPASSPAKPTKNPTTSSLTSPILHPLLNTTSIPNSPGHRNFPKAPNPPFTAEVSPTNVQQPSPERHLHTTIDSFPNLTLFNQQNQVHQPTSVQPFHGVELNEKQSATQFNKTHT